MSIPLEKVPPQNLDAEQSVLGAMLIDKEAVVKAVQVLTPDDFYRDANGHIFEAAANLFNRNEAVDLITLSEELKQSGQLDQVGGVSYVAGLANSVPTSANVEHYARIVLEKSLLRRLISVSTRITQMGYEGEEDTEALLDRAEQMIFELAQRKSRSGFAHLKSILMETFERIEFLHQNKGGITGVPSGFADLDKLTSGFQPSDLVIVAARPSMGKTALCLNIAQYASLRKELPVAVFSLEMSREQLVTRMLCAEAMVDQQKVRTGQLADKDWQQLTMAAGPLARASLFIDDTPGITPMEMRAKCRRLKAEHGLSLIVIDYLQLMQGGRKRTENRQQEISDISRSMKMLAREIQAPVIALSQLSRAVEQRQDKRPMMSDLRESGSLEQDADIVMFIYRDEYYHPEDSEKKGQAEIIVAKQRNGPVGSVDLGFMKEYTKFVNLDKQHGE
ncbi:replicative DNA helicase [Phosphitispora fastidiosa]|uniref:replicative DNA helicase n=1 Tax=Phosphitispora fastidiosa TaxID=2837202 RepID=UPI001E2C34A1|nr:replicative DNA helicase [Phosphitispora fastidiosa]MBU7007516.1 replicative DNA helicase [Phosphitispora fastidiosa]